MTREADSATSPQAGFQRLLRHATIIPMLVLVLMAAAFTALVAYRGRVMASVEQTEAVLRRSYAIDTVHLELGLVTREYLFSGQESLLRAKAELAQRIDAEFEGAIGMVAEKPEQVARYRRAQEASQAWRKVLDETVADRRAGRTGVTALNTSPMLKAAHEALQEAVNVEEAIHRQRSEHAWQATLQVAGGGGALLAIAAVILGWWARGQLHDLARRFEAMTEETRQRALDLERVNRALNALVEASPLPVIALDTQARVTLWNDAATRVFGWGAAEVIGRPLPQVNAEQEKSAREVFERSMRGENLINKELERRTKDGKILHISFASAPLRDAQGRIIGMIGISTDVTDRRRAEMELTQAKEASEAANRTKDEFLAVLSHELRTPLTPALAVLQMLEDHGALEVGARDDVALARRNIELEARLIDDLLDLTRVSRGKLQMRMETVDIHAVLGHALAVCNNEISAKSAEMRMELKAKEHFVLGDAARLQQVFWNLVKNAVKFTPHGGRLTVRTRGEKSMGAKGHGGDGAGAPHSPASPHAHARQHIVVEIIDTGIGIPADLLPRIFDPFEQGEQRITRQFGGLGLGLAISKALVDGHGGRLQASSEGPGHGATFTVELPTVRPPATGGQGAQPNGESQRRALKILLVEDHADTARVMTRLLRGMGHSVTTANCVADGLKAACANEVELIISDIGLPDGTGVDLIREVRKQSAVPAIALSGFGMDADVSRSREAGFAEHLTKPVDMFVLERAIEQVVRGNEE